MEKKDINTMIIKINEDDLTIFHNGQMATYWKNGNKKIFTGYDEETLPAKIFFHDSRTKHTRSE